MKWLVRLAVVAIVALIGFHVVTEVNWSSMFGASSAKAACNNTWTSPTVVGVKGTKVQDVSSDCTVAIDQDGPGCIFVTPRNFAEKGPFCPGATTVELPRNITSVRAQTGTVTLSWQLRR